MEKKQLCITLLLTKGGALSQGDTEILLSHRYRTGIFDGYWSLPTGKVEAEETPKEAAIREAQEELGISVKKLELVSTLFIQASFLAPHATSDNNLEIYQDARANPYALSWSHVDFVFLIEEWDDNPYNAEPHKHDEIAFFPFNSLPIPLTPIAKQGLPIIRQGQKYGEIFYRWTS